MVRTPSLIFPPHHFFLTLKVSTMSRTYKKTPPTRKRISDGAEPLGMWAVFRDSRSKGPNFNYLHATREFAVAEAQRLAAESIAKHGPVARSIYYVVFIDAKVGLADGKLHDAGKSLIQPMP
jgi:hypothetical protein